MSTFLHPSFVVLHMGLVIWGALLWQRQRSLGTLIVIITAAGLAYDNLILTLGASIGVGSTLEALNVPRYLLHAVMTPLLVLTAFELARRARVPMAQSALSRNLIIGLAVVLVGVGLAQSFVGMHLKPACHDGILRYAERVTENQLCEGVVYEAGVLEARGLPPLASIATVIAVAFWGLMIGRRAGLWWLLAGAVVMFITAAVPASRVGLWVGNGGEMVLLASLLFVTARLQAREGLGTFGSVQPAAS